MKKIFRLKKNHDIASVVGLKQKLVCTFFIIYYQKNQLTYPKVAISVSHRYGDAVERNYAKRVIRAIVQPKLKEMAPVNMVVVIRNAFKNQPFVLLQGQLIEMIKKINKKQGENNETKNK